MPTQQVGDGYLYHAMEQKQEPLPNEEIRSPHTDRGHDHVTGDFPHVARGLLQYQQEASSLVLPSPVIYTSMPWFCTKLQECCGIPQLYHSSVPPGLVFRC